MKHTETPTRKTFGGIHPFVHLHLRAALRGVIGLSLVLSAMLLPVTLAEESSSASARKVVYTSYERAIVSLTNKQRASVGCKPLKVNKKLRKAARLHSTRMARRNTMSHRLPGEARLGKRITKAGYRGWTRVAENIAAGFTNARVLVDAWWNSPSHRRNITDCSLREIGVGVVTIGGRTFWTQNFGRR